MVLENHIIFRKDRVNQKGGGVLIAVKNDFKCNQKHINSEFEDIFVEILIKDVKLLFISLYRPPNLLIDFKTYLKNIFNEIDLQRYHFICFLGDLNLNYSNNLDSNVIQMKENFLYYGLNQIITSPTYPSKNPKSILDLVFTNRTEIVTKVDISENISQLCDHLSIDFKLDINYEKKNDKTVEYFDYNSENLKKLNEGLQSIDWFLLTQNADNIDSNFDIM